MVLFASPKRQVNFCILCASSNPEANSVSTAIEAQDKALKVRKISDPLQEGLPNILGVDFYIQLSGNPTRKERVIACKTIGGQGNVEAGIETMRLLQALRPDFMFLAGIAGGMNESFIHKGDVVLAEDVIRQRFAEIHDGVVKKETKSLTAGDTKTKDIRVDFENKFGAVPYDSAGWEDVLSEPNRLPQLHRGTMYSTAARLDCIDTRNDLIKAHGRLHAVEQEAAGFFLAIDRFNSDGKYFVRGFAIKGISDHAHNRYSGAAASREKEKRFAARNAAITLLRFMQMLDRSNIYWRDV